MTPEQSTQTSKKQTKKVLYLGLILVGLTILSALAWFSYSSVKKERKATQLANDLQQQVNKLNADDSSNSNNTGGDEKIISSPELGLSMNVPKDWQSDSKITDGQLQYFEISSKDLVLEEQAIGGSDVSKGFLINIYPVEQGEINTFNGLEASLKENGTLIPVKLSLGKYKAVQYSYAYEGPERLYIRLQLDDSTFVTAELTSEGSEQSHYSFDKLKDVLSSISRI